MAPDREEDLTTEKNPRPLDEDDISLLRTYVCMLSSMLFIPFSCFVIPPHR